MKTIESSESPKTSKLAIERPAVLAWFSATALFVSVPNILINPVLILPVLQVAFGLWAIAKGMRLSRCGACDESWDRTQAIILRAVKSMAPATVFGLTLSSGKGWSSAEMFNAVLTTMVIAKLLELKIQRDVYVIVAALFSTLATCLLLDQGLLMAIYAVVSCSLIIASWSVASPFSAPGASCRTMVTNAARELAPALAMFTVAALLIPVPTNRLWSVQRPEKAAKTGGMSDSMSPGDISKLVRNPEPAFRVRFAGAAPDRSQMYWRVATLDTFDGHSWRETKLYTSHGPRQVHDFEPSGSWGEYDAVFEASDSGRVPVLDWADPSEIDPDLSISDTMTVGSYYETSSPARVFRGRYNFSGHLGAHVTTPVAEMIGAVDIAENPRTAALMAEWVRESPAPEALVSRALAYFRSEPFRYTLNAGKYGAHQVDQFLFDRRAGFCEHYSNAFVTMMRMAGVPARVVTGYQGGELSRTGEFWTVRQSDAHAWAEVFIAGKGWVRVDPTSAVAPERIERGIEASLDASEIPDGLRKGQSPFVVGISGALESANELWMRAYVGYNSTRRDAYLRDLARFVRTRKDTLLFFLAAVLSGALAALIGPRRHAAAVQPETRMLRTYERITCRLGLSRTECETHLQFGYRAAARDPSRAHLHLAFAETYCAVHYGNVDSRELESILRQFSRRVQSTGCVEPQAVRA